MRSVEAENNLRSLEADENNLRSLEADNNLRSIEAEEKHLRSLEPENNSRRMNIGHDPGVANTEG